MCAKLMATRTIQTLKKNPRFEENAIEAYSELYKLVAYYQNEVKQNQMEIKRAGDDKEHIAYLNGLIEAYNDNIGEISYILNLMLGKLNDLDSKKREAVMV